MDFYKHFPSSSLNLDESYEDLLDVFQRNEITTHTLLTTPPFELAKVYRLDQAQLSSFLSVLKSEESKAIVVECPFGNNFVDGDGNTAAGNDINRDDISRPLKSFNQIRQTNQSPSIYRTSSISTTDRNTPRHFSTADPQLDKLLSGGIHLGEVTQVFGASSTGKSQFLMQLACAVQRPVSLGGLAAQCVLISTEGLVETRRLGEMVEWFEADRDSGSGDDPVTNITDPWSFNISDDNNRNGGGSASGNVNTNASVTGSTGDGRVNTVADNAIAVAIVDSNVNNTGKSAKTTPITLQNIYVINCNDLETQDHILAIQLPTLLRNHRNIKLIIIDSISHHIRVELGYDWENLRNHIDELGMRLHDLALRFGVAVVCSNQVSDRPVRDVLNSDFKKVNYDFQIGWLNGFDRSSILERQQGVEIQGRTQKEVATLGTDWDKFINVKILLLKKYKYNKQFHKVEELKKKDEKDGNSESENDDKNNNYKSVRKKNKNNVNVEVMGVSLNHNNIIKGIDEKYWQQKRWFKVIYSPRCGGSSSGSGDNDEVEFKIEQRGLTTELFEKS